MKSITGFIVVILDWVVNPIARGLNSVCLISGATRSIVELRSHKKSEPIISREIYTRKKSELYLWICLFFNNNIS